MSNDVVREALEWMERQQRELNQIAADEPRPPLPEKYSSTHYAAAAYGVCADKLRTALASQGEGQREPDYVFDAENWDTTYDWGDRSVLADMVATEGDYEPWRFETLWKGEPVWARNVVLTRDEDGCPDETEVRWFNSEEEARACQPCPFPPEQEQQP